MAQGVHEHSPTTLAFKIIRAFRVPSSLCQTPFQGVGGQIPSTLEQFNAMKANIVQWSSLLEPSNPWSVHHSL
eukprot:5337631-Prorocentrum_lima.AAC.1